ncbi:MAG: TonB-dependent receptor plug domain-containing protein [Sphingomonadaceae bacterium]
MKIGCAGAGRTLAMLLCSAALVASPAAAQETGDAPPPEAQPAAGARVYAPADFARFAPRTALDMLRQVPGFSISEGDTSRRGLGQATANVLINGERISGKQNSVVTELARISAGDVVRIEILDGASLDIPGLSGQVANVVVESEAGGGQFAWRPELRTRNTPPVLLAGEASYSGSAGAIDYTLGLSNNSFRSGSAGPETVADAEGEIIDLREEEGRFDGDRPRLSASFKYDGPGEDVGNLNLSYERFWFDGKETSLRSGPGLPDRSRLFTDSEDEYNYELGGDYEFALMGGRLKLIGLHRFEHSPFDTRVVTSFSDLRPDAGNRFVRIGDESETIARAEYRWSGGDNDWQLAAEGAFNSLDNVSNLFVLQPDGEFAEIPLPGGTAKVTEDRGEASLSWGRPLAADLSVQSSLGAEYSTISQTGPLGKTRSFFRPKGFVSAAWKAAGDLDLNFRIEREVGQLNFFDFLASTNISTGSENVSNPDLVPQQSWDFEVEAVKGLGEFGKTTVKLFAAFIEDIVDQIPIGENGQSPGNVDRAISYGIDATGTLLLDPLGWPGAKLDARLLLRDSELDDPLTGEPRPISDRTNSLLDLQLRHDIPESDWAWGTSLFTMRNNREFRLDEISLYSESPAFVSLFIEHKDVLGLTVRATLRNLLGMNENFERIVFVDRRDGPTDFIESRSRDFGPILAFSISGKI